MDTDASTRRVGTSRLTVNAIATAFVAALTVQVFHELCHGVAALLVGGRFEALNLFAARTTEPVGGWQEVIVAGNAAIMNIIGAILAMLLLFRVRAGLGRMFLLYFGAYSLFTGFGYLMFDALFRVEQGTGDWARVLALLDGGWALRAAIAAIGTAGVVWSFFWVPRAVLRLVPDPADRVRTGGAMLLVPYFVINIVVTVLALWHPLGAEGTAAVVLQYWLGSFPLFWGFFMVGWWLDVKKRMPGSWPADRASIGWAVAAVVTLLVAAVVLLPTVTFG